MLPLASVSCMSLSAQREEEFALQQIYFYFQRPFAESVFGELRRALPEQQQTGWQVCYNICLGINRSLVPARCWPDKFHSSA